MRLLLDTHAVLWFLAGDPRLSASVQHVISDAQNHVFVSAVSAWEVAVKLRIGKLELDFDRFLRELAVFDWLGVEHRHLRRLKDLPLHHRDPFDHLLIAQALEEDLAFVTADTLASAYGLRILPVPDAPLGVSRRPLFLP